MRLRSLALLLTAAASLSVAAAACGSGKHHGSATPTPSPSASFSPTPTVTPPPGAVVEVEPNDPTKGDPPTAIAGTGTLSFWGVCADDTDIDGFALSVGSGLVAAQITWTESAAYDDLDLAISNSSGSIRVVDDNVPPLDSPANVQAVLTTNAGAHVPALLEVDCYNHSPNVAYTGSVSVP